MTWEQWYCPNQACDSEAWMVQRDPATYDAWRVAAHRDDRPFTVAATDPVCPCCGMTLLTIVEFEGALIEPVGVEVGPVFDFVRGLA